MSDIEITAEELEELTLAIQTITKQQSLKNVKSIPDDIVRPSKKIDWAKHRKWLVKNAKHREIKYPLRNPPGKYNQDRIISMKHLQDFLSRNYKISRKLSSVSQNDGAKKQTISLKEFNRWYESKKKTAPVHIQEPKRPFKSLKTLLKRIRLLAAPRKYKIAKAVPSWLVKPSALKFKAGKALTLLAKPKRDLTPKIPPRVLKIISKQGMKRLVELAKHVPKPKSLNENNCNLKRWPFDCDARKTKTNSNKGDEDVKIQSNHPANDEHKKKHIKRNKQQPDVNVFVLVCNDSENIRKTVPQSKPEKAPCTGQCRIEELAQPQQPVAIPFKNRLILGNAISDRVLNYSPSSRIVELSKPKTVAIPFSVVKAQKEQQSKDHGERRKQQREIQRQ